MERGFKRKTIIAIIEHKVNCWVKTISDVELREEILSSYILTGGAIASMLQGEQPNDFDIYFSDVDICAKVAEYYLEHHKKNTAMVHSEVIKHTNRVEVMIKSAGVLGVNVDVDQYAYFESSPVEAVSQEMDNFLGDPMSNMIPENKGKYTATYITSNAISLTDSIQLILRFVGEPSKIHENFDFLHATNFYSKKTGLVLVPEAVESIVTRELKYVGSLYPIASIFRLRKFIQRGWTINVGEILKICWDVNHLDLHDLNVLKDQLCGVDTQYMLQLLDLLASENRTLDRSYLVELVNRIFEQEYIMFVRAILTFITLAVFGVFGTALQR